MARISMKVGVITCAYNEEKLIGACINQFKGLPVEHLVLVSKSPWAGEALPPDRTAEIAKSLGAKVLIDNFPPDEGQRHVGLDYFKNMDWCLIVDCDEFYTRDSLDKILDFLKNADKDIYRCEEMLVYFGDLDHIAVREDGSHGPPVIAMRPHMRFSHIREVNYPDYFIPGTTLHHLSYIRSNADMKKKISSWGHASEVIPGWYENVWLKWTPDMMNFHPTMPNIFHKSEYNPLPDEIKKLLRR